MILYPNQLFTERKFSTEKEFKKKHGLEFNNRYRTFFGFERCDGIVFINNKKRNFILIKKIHLLVNIEPLSYLILYKIRLISLNGVKNCPNSFDVEPLPYELVKYSYIFPPVSANKLINR